MLVGGVVPGGEVPEGSLTFMEPSQPRLAQARSAAHAQMKGEEMFNVLLGLGWDKRCNFISAVYYSRLESDHRATDNTDQSAGTSQTERSSFGYQ